MQILVISDAGHPQINGVVRTYEGLSPALGAHGHQMHIIAPADCGFNIPCPQYPEIRLSIGGLFSLHKKIDSIRETTTPFNLHIHIATEGPLGWAARRYALKHNLKFSTCYHTEFPDYVAKRVPSFFQSLTHKLATKFIRAFHKPSSTIFVATRSLEQKLIDRGYKNNFSPLTRGVDFSRFHPAEETIFNHLKKPIALYVGRVAVEKNLESFLAALWHGSKVIVGDGPDRTILSQTYPDALFTGKKEGDELAHHYQSADIFVFPSKTDTFGMVLTEAMACGLPIAAYPVTGPVDIITNPNLGALNNTLETAMAQAYTLCQNTSSITRYNHAQEHYSWDTAAQQFINGIKQYCS